MKSRKPLTCYWADDGFLWHTPDMTDGGRSNADIARRLQALMTALGRNQSAFAVLVEITQPAMSNYVKPHFTLSREHFSRYVILALDDFTPRDMLTHSR